MSATATTLDSTAVETLAGALRGELIDPQLAGYDEARRLYNAMIDKRPALIARCVDVADVIACVRFAAGTGVDLAVRGGGHNGGGLGSVDGGLVVDLTPLRGVRVDPGARTVTVAGGTTLGEVDHATHPFGLAVPAGIISTTGVGGLTLGGGLGHLTRKYGLSIDNLVGADVVLADGTLVRATESEHDDLFWALRGGGGNFGVVTSFTFQARPVSTVVAGPMLWPLEQAGEALALYADFIAAAPEALNGFFAFLTVPPAPPFPEELHLQKMCGVVWCYAGPAAEAQAALAPIRSQLPPALDGVTEMPLPALQSAFDGLYPPGDQWYWRADFVEAIPAAAIEAHVAHARELPTWKSTMHLYPVDGAAGRVAPDATAWSYRGARWAQVIVGVDSDPASAGALRDWTVRYWKALHPYAAGGAYVNFLMDEGDDRVRASYGANYERLARIKAAYDPGNLFHVNQNIRPA
ncbi:MAG TPA: FAD-binding oxidoreductase [Gaiellaceae bacterium]|nr:FAD-binding oxidoreductase [Gaiellaceae bacterium]